MREKYFPTCFIYFRKGGIWHRPHPQSCWLVMHLCNEFISPIFIIYFMQESERSQISACGRQSWGIAEEKEIKMVSERMTEMHSLEQALITVNVNPATLPCHSLLIYFISCHRHVCPGVFLTTIKCVFLPAWTPNEPAFVRNGKTKIKKEIDRFKIVLGKEIHQ